jgi:phosphatidylserine/phosphatidylglycerophosphate/cardiolipin synthase-like enzyme
MSPVTTRQILRSSSASRNEIRELLQGLFVRELLHPSRCLWLVSPWVRDIEVIDNRTAAFRGLDPELPPTWLRLSDVLRRLMDRGTRVVLATRPEPESKRFCRALHDTIKGRLPEDALILFEREILHAKGLVGNDFGLTGSMNFTYSGIEFQTEFVTLQRGSAEVAQLRVAFQAEYGGAL